LKSLGFSNGLLTGRLRFRLTQPPYQVM